ncbi:MAG: restriction endonuclease subunit S, partial [Bacteroidetes bacterium]
GSTVYKEDGRPFIRSQNIGWGNLILDDIAFIDDEIHQTFPNTEIKYNDVFLNISGASIGRSSFANEKLVGGNVNQHVCIIRVIDKKLHPIFLNLFLLSKSGQKQIDSFQSGGNRQGLNIGQIRTFQIPLPPTIEEQTAIATALSDADALISSLEKLLTKKRNIKQGAMQRLLQPKEGWKEVSIFQLADGKKELFDDGDWIESEHITDKGIRLIQTGNIGIGSFVEKENQKFIYEDSFYKLGCKLLKVGDLLICRLAEPAGRACIFPFIGEDKVITSVDVTIFRPRAELVNRQFLSQIFSTSNWFKSISDLCGGTTHKRISRGALGRIKILLPNIEEQTRIATILSDMDAEISALESKLEKYKKVKLGMMQNLLTGKIRLV